MTQPGASNSLEREVNTSQLTGRPVVYSTHGVISSGHYLTSMASDTHRGPWRDSSFPSRCQIR